MSNLAALRDRVESLLNDASNDRWTTDEVDDAIRRALIRTSERRPRQLVTTIILSQDGREVSLSGVSDLLRPLRVWWPYTAADPEVPPRWVPWDLHGPDTLYLDVAEEPQTDEVVRLFYAAMHTVDGLDSADTTTLATDEEGVLVIGAAGYAALARAAYVNEAVTLSGKTPDQWRAWGEARLAEFEVRLTPRYEPARWAVWPAD